MQAGLVTLSTNKKGTIGHGTGNHTQNPLTSGRGTFAMDDNRPLLMLLMPCKIMMILNRRQGFRARSASYVLVDDVVIGTSVTPHQIHRLPILLAFLCVEVQPT